VEGQGIAAGYLGNTGSPMQSRVFFERKEARDFIFADPLDTYITSPEGEKFFDTKIPYADLTYTFNGGDQKKEERLKGLLTRNFGKRINAGGETDYIYGRGHYPSNGNKSISYRLFGSYVTDKYEARGYVSNYYFITAENGGLTNDACITNPSQFTDGRRTIDSKAFPVRFSNAFNTIRDKQYFLSHRYNFGSRQPHEDTVRFVPIASLEHTLAYTSNRRHFTSTSLAALDTCYSQRYASPDSALHDRPSSSSLHNTFSFSLREGFRDWVKFGLAAFVRFEQRRFVSLTNELTKTNFKEFSTYIGGEWSKRRGRFLTYNARGEIGLLGDDLGEFRLSGNLRTHFPLGGEDASFSADVAIKNLTPAFFLRRYHSRYFIWDNDFRNEQQVYAAGTILLAATKTRLNAGVYNVRNYIFTGVSGPAQFTGNIQVLYARLAQSFRIGVFGWDNEVVVQRSSEDVLPLPLLCVYTNAYMDVKPVSVLSLQLGFDVHYFTAYNAPYYEPATMLFHLQPSGEQVAVGNFPLLNAYANFHLKQTRFFVSAYNLASLFLTPNYFSLPHYPLNPFLLKFGISVHFND
jgi:hypothetical protein